MRTFRFAVTDIAVGDVTIPAGDAIITTYAAAGLDPAHYGPDADAFDKATNARLEPRKLDNTLAFMVESRWRLRPTAFALEGGALDASYADCWAPLGDHFTPGN